MERREQLVARSARGAQHSEGEAERIRGGSLRCGHGAGLTRGGLCAECGGVWPAFGCLPAKLWLVGVREGGEVEGAKIRNLNQTSP
jgi:hypothetical protein